MATVNNSSTENATKSLQTKREDDKGGGKNHCKTNKQTMYINNNYFSVNHFERYVNKIIILCTSHNIPNEKSETKINNNHERKHAKNNKNHSFVPLRKCMISLSSSSAQFSEGMLRIVFLIAVFFTIITAAAARRHNFSSNRNGLWDAHQKECPMAFHEIGGRCYFYGYFPLNWFRAAEFCHSFGKGVSLASIETAQENYHIKQWLLVNGDHNSGVWIGGSDNGHEGRWAWFPTGQLMDYSNWGPSQPSGEDQNCMYMVGGILGYQWADFHCDFNMKFLCEHGVNDEQPW